MATTRYQTTEYNRSQRVQATLRDVYESARSFHLTHKHIFEQLQERIYSTRDWEKLTAYHRGYFAGMHQALRDSLYRYHLEWRVRLNGALIKSADVPDGEWSKVSMGEHVWSDAPDHLFSTSEGA